MPKAAPAIPHAPSPSGPGPIGGIDRRLADKLRRGRLDPDARIDLHGMTAARAHAALTRFLLTAHQRADRLILVITGKGRAEASAGLIPGEGGVLRRAVPHWLEEPPLRPIVLHIMPAHARHGGNGALYVYLRRVRG
ncbi:MAG: Smr/MutS family protein [Pseudomonadota bacterium]